MPRTRTKTNKMRIRVLHSLAFLAALFLSSGSGVAAPTYVTIQPIIVCDDSGTTCANLPNGAHGDLFKNATQAIWAQPSTGLNVNFFGSRTLNSTDWLNANDTDALELLNPFATDTNRHENSLVVNMFVVDSLTIGGDLNAGLGNLGANGFIISDIIFDINRLDTIAHELGHNLGLDHASALGDNNNLMREGGPRNTPTAIGQITIDSVTGLDIISLAQATVVSGSQFLTEHALPAPGMAALLGIGVLITIRQRRRAGDTRLAA